MTIDEVEKIYKAITNEGTPCPRYCMLPCDKCVQECKQIATWLEELKAYKEKPEGWMWDEAERKGYNKAIDDFVESFKKLIEDDSNPILMTECKKLGVWNNYNFEKIAEQLKAGGENV